MIFGFPTVEHRNYNRNFLKTVVFQVTYDRIKGLVERKNEVASLFKDIFPRLSTPAGNEIAISFTNSQTPIVQQVKSDDTIQMRSPNAQKVLSINSTTFSLTISGQEYKSFEKMKSEISKLNTFLDAFGISTVNRIAVRKINVIDFKYTDNLAEILNNLINPNLISNPNYYPSPEYVRQNIHSVNYTNDPFHLLMKYGVNMPPVAPQKTGQLIIDIDLFKLSKTNSKVVFEISEEINSEIFNIFNWAVNDNLLTLLNG